MVDAARNPDYLHKMAEAVQNFLSAFTEFLSLHEETGTGLGRGIVPAVTPREDVDPADISAAAARVSRAAGRAMYAASQTETKVQVEGKTQPVDPIAAWRTVTLPKPLLEPDDVIDATEQILGRLEAMELKAAAELPPTSGVEALHPTIWGPASKLWRDGHFRSAVHSAAEALTTQLRIRVGQNGMDATALYGKVFSEKAPLLQWPGDPDDLTVKSMRNGLGKYAPGVNLTIRNTTAHGTAEMSAQDAMERLSALSLLARWIDACEDAASPKEGS
ncbi:TIGR02391 family protein [Streptomyces sp. NPDC006967]|uniref:TIGR02391 family protein n=1 Tax=unclassified Streptomyces TaxID=2593676 RepID=UPI0033F90647